MSDIFIASNALRSIGKYSQISRSIFLFSVMLCVGLKKLRRRVLRLIFVCYDSMIIKATLDEHDCSISREAVLKYVNVANIATVKLTG